jgi:argininosuccinate lyase
LDLAVRQIDLTAGVVAGLEDNRPRMYEALEAGFSQAADLAEHLMVRLGLDYRSAYRIVGAAVRRAAASGLRGIDISADLLAQCAVELIGSDPGIAGLDLTSALDPRAIVASRVTLGGAEPSVVRGMAAEVVTAGRAAAAAAARRTSELDAAESKLLTRCQELLER